MPSKAEMKALKAGLRKVDILKVEISKKRDELREVARELEEIIESMENAVDGMEEGARSLNDAVDCLSQYL